MAIDYDAVLARRERLERRYDEAQVQLYGVGIGLGMDPLDRQQLDFLLEDGLRVMPSFATVAAWDVRFALGLGMEWAGLIHVSQRLTLDGPLPVSAAIVTETRTTAAFDKPARSATLLVNETAMTDAATGRRLAVLESVYLARDFRVSGAPEGGPEPLPKPPGRSPDAEVTLPTSPQVALVYRLLGGRALIHCDPDVARAQGFERPIMHGLSTWGHACHAVLRGACGYDPARLRSFAADFTAPVYPGETLVTRLWEAGEAVHFETVVPARGRTVLSNGLAVRR